ncbi:MAG: hypothetical protein ACRCYR_00220 [Phycicoccus sp.]
MTTSQNQASEPATGAENPTLPGPDDRSARTARRTAGIALAVLLLAAGGATAAYATGEEPAGTGNYGVVTTDGSGTQDRTADDPATGKGAASDGSTSSERRDCPEKDGGGSGSGDDGEQGTTPAPSPSTEAPAPDTSTL